jgi:hypothetical protein
MPGAEALLLAPGDWRLSSYMLGSDKKCLYKKGIYSKGRESTFDVYFAQHEVTHLAYTGGRIYGFVVIVRFEMGSKHWPDCYIG